MLGSKYHSKVMFPEKAGPPVSTKKIGVEALLFPRLNQEDSSVR